MTREPALALIIGLLGGPGGLIAQQPLGPLTTEEGSPLQRLSYTPMTEPPEVVGSGRFRADLWLGYSNIFEQDSSATHVVMMDLERLITALTARWGVSERLEVGGRLTVETTGPGFLDSFVLWYHDALGFGQANRDRFPSGRYEQRLSDGERPLLAMDSRRLALEDVRLFAKWRALASRDGRSALGLKLEARVPTYENRVGAERSDLALLALGRLGAGPWYLHGMLSVATARSSPELEPVMRDASYGLMLALERPLGSRLSLLLQYQLATSVLRDFHDRELDGPARNVLIGLAGRAGDDW
ncbi:MAG TPA: DUF3187 family protein, partial [Longimicrobiales bacterium]|nr:DUF3187 family protein [Longimicrobiales bacterium]